MVAVSSAAVARGASEKGPAIREDDIHKALEIMLTITARDGLSLEGKCAVLMGAGTLLTSLPAENVASLHEKLVSSIEEKLRHVTQADRIDAAMTTQIFKLALTALECTDNTKLCGSTAVSSTESVTCQSESPIAIGTLMNHWDLIESAFTNFDQNEAIVEAACHTLISILSDHKDNHHVVPLLQRTVSTLCTAFKKKPSVYILAAMRTILRVFGFFVEEEIVTTMQEVLEVCVSQVLGFFENTPTDAFTCDPDIAGMSVDTLNAALTTPIMTAMLLQTEQAKKIIYYTSQYLATCQHPRVRLTLLLFLLRTSKWLTPKNAAMEMPLWLAMHNTSGVNESKRCEAFQKWKESVKASHEQAKAIISKCLESLLKQLYKLLTTVFEDSAEWIGFIGSINVSLLSCAGLAVTEVMTDVLTTVEPTLVDLLSSETLASTLHVLTTCDNHRLQSVCLCQIADEAQARARHQRA